MDLVIPSKNYLKLHLINLRNFLSSSKVREKILFLNVVEYLLDSMLKTDTSDYECDTSDYKRTLRTKQR